MSKNLGSIFFDVDVDTSRLNKVDGEVKRVTSTVTKLATAITAAFSAKKIIDYANSWTEVNNKLINNVREHENLADVTNRVFEIAQRSRVEMSAVADLYGRMERATRELGISTEVVGQMTETVSKSLIVSGASAAETSSVITQLSQAMASGVLRGEEFNSVAENGPRLMRALADATGLTIGQLRALAKDGKITTEMLTSAFQSQADVIDKEFNNTIMTMGQAFVVAGNNATQFVGTTSMVTGGIQAFNGILITVSENLHLVANVGMIIAGVFGARMVGALTAATQAMIAQTIAARGAVGAMGMLKGALSFIGGPMGAAFLAGSAILYFYNQSKQATQSAMELAQNADVLTQSFVKMTQAQAASKLLEYKEQLLTLNKALEVQNDLVEKRQKQVEYTKGSFIESKHTKAVEELTISLAKQEEAQKAVNDVTKMIETLTPKAVDGINLVIDAMTGEVRAARPLENAMLNVKKAFMEATGAKENYNAVKLDTAADISNTDKLIGKLGQEIELYTVAAGSARELMKAKQAAAMAGASPTQLALIQAQTGLVEGLSQAEADAEKARRESEKADKKGAKESASSANQQIEFIQSLADEYSQLKAEVMGFGEINQAVFQLGTDATAEQIAQVKELVARKQGMQIIAEQQTIDKITAIRNQGLASIDKLYKDEEISAEQSAQAKLKIERDFIQAKMDIAREKSVSPMQELQGTVDPLAQMANEHAQKLAMIEAYNAQVLASEQVSQEQIAGIHRQYDQQRLDAMWNIWKQQSSINEMLGSAFDSLASTASNSLTGFITGTMTAKEAAQNLGRTIFNSIINSLVQMGIEAVKNMILGQTMGAAATGMAVAQGAVATAAWTPAAVAASIATLGAASATGTAAFGAAMASGKALSLAGGRRTGGSVVGGSMYEVGEGNRPEIFRAGDGKQYMIPGNRGDVISNNELGGKGGSVVNVNIINNTGADVQTRQNQSENGVTLEVLINDADMGGPYFQALQRNSNIERRTD